MVATEKDAIKLPESFSPSVPLYFLAVEIEFLEGERAFWKAVYRASKGGKDVKR